MAKKRNNKIKKVIPEIKIEEIVNKVKDKTENTPLSPIKISKKQKVVLIIFSVISILILLFLYLYLYPRLREKIIESDFNNIRAEIEGFEAKYNHYPNKINIDTKNNGICFYLDSIDMNSADAICDVSTPADKLIHYSKLKLNADGQKLQQLLKVTSIEEANDVCNSFMKNSSRHIFNEDLTVIYFTNKESSEYYLSSCRNTFGLFNNLGNIKK
jgi:hypothetical protein